MSEAVERVLTERELNRALLARQGLLDRHAGSIAGALERVGGIQAQYAPAMYVGLWSRLRGLDRPDLTRALEQRDVIQATLLRSTIHLVSRSDYWPMTLAIAGERRRWHLRAIRNDPPEAEWRAAADRLRLALAGGPMLRRNIDALLGPGRATYVGLYLDLVRVPPSGTWERRSADLFGLAEDWVGPPIGTPAEGVGLLITRYLQAFGPAAAVDIATWAGLPVKTITTALPHLRLRVFADRAGKRLVDLPDSPLPAADTPAPVRFLPTWDATLLVRARRTQILPERHRAKVFSTKMPHSVNTFLVDGAVAGTWRYQNEKIAIDEFEPLPDRVIAEVRLEAERLAQFHRARGGSAAALGIVAPDTPKP